MNEIPEFPEALQVFLNFLVKQGHPDEVFWVFREDLWQLSTTEALVKYPPDPPNETLARKVFAEGRERGLVEITAILAVANRVAATVWFPKSPEEQVQGWNQGMKLAIANPLPRGKLIGSLRWTLFKFLPRYQHYQRAAISIGTRAWASS